MVYVKHFNILGVDAVQVPCIELQGVPTTATEGAVGLLGMNMLSEDHEIYQCVKVEGSVYTWKPIVGGSTSVTITKAEVNNDGELILTLSDKTEINVGMVKGEKGDIGARMYVTKGLWLNTTATLVSKTSVGGNAREGDYILDNEGKLFRITSVTSTHYVIQFEIDISATDGKSAYELALEHGFEGTEEEWLESLKGKDGTDCVSIIGAELNADSELIISLSNGTIINVGSIKGDMGSGCYVNGVPTDLNFTSDPQTQIDNIVDDVESQQTQIADNTKEISDIKDRLGVEWHIHQIDTMEATIRVLSGRGEKYTYSSLFYDIQSSIPWIIACKHSGQPVSTCILVATGSSAETGSIDVMSIDKNGTWRSTATITASGLFKASDVIKF